MKASERVALWRKNNPEKWKEQRLKYLDKMKKEKPEVLALRYRKRNYKAKYGITLEDYEQMLLEQDNVCFICKGDNDGKYLAVDHCHESGKVRKLLCTKCNLTVEHIENAKADIQKYIDYIEDHGRY